MAEAGSEPGAGIIALANCLYNAMLRCDGDLAAALIEYGYTDRRKTPTTEVSECVSAVFDRGELLLDDDVLYFCRSDCESARTGWHSTLDLVCTIGHHNFYREATT
jgi:spore germination cell wall hydrolase CwlJ-like protein